MNLKQQESQNTSQCKHFWLDRCGIIAPLGVLCYACRRCGLEVCVDITEGIYPEFDIQKNNEVDYIKDIYKNAEKIIVNDFYNFKIALDDNNCLVLPQEYDPIYNTKRYLWSLNVPWRNAPFYVSKDEELRDELSYWEGYIRRREVKMPPKLYFEYLIANKIIEDGRHVLVKIAELCKEISKQLSEKR